MLYSSLYRSLLWPALRSDVNGEYTDAKRQVVKANFNYYTEPSLWDTYRNKDVLLGLVSPQVALDVIKSMKDVGDKKGSYLPSSMAIMALLLLWALTCVALISLI